MFDFLEYFSIFSKFSKKSILLFLSYVHFFSIFCNFLFLFNQFFSPMENETLILLSDDETLTHLAYLLNGPTISVFFVIGTALNFFVIFILHFRMFRRKSCISNMILLSNDLKFYSSGQKTCIKANNPYL